MPVLKRIGPFSAFKIGVVTYGIVGLIAGVFCSLLTLTGTSSGLHGHMPFGSAIGLFAVILCPMVYGLLGGIAAVISAFLYNLAARWIGGLEIEIN